MNSHDAYADYFGQLFAALCLDCVSNAFEAEPGSAGEHCPQCRRRQAAIHAAWDSAPDYLKCLHVRRHEDDGPKNLMD